MFAGQFTLTGQTEKSHFIPVQAPIGGVSLHSWHSSAQLATEPSPAPSLPAVKPLFLSFSAKALDGLIPS